MGVRKLFLEVPQDASPHQRMVLTMANHCSRLFLLADWLISHPCGPAEVVQKGDTMRSGALLAAIELRDLLAESSEGREALRNLGFQPRLQQLEGE